MSPQLPYELIALFCLPCPDENALAAHAQRGGPSESINRHISSCNDCSALVHLLATGSDTEFSLEETLGRHFGAERRTSKLPSNRLGRYLVQGEVGAGNMGLVLAGYDPDLKRQVALKVLLQGNVPGGRERLEREAQVLASLSHPNIVAAYDVGYFQDEVFLAMELLEGLDLTTWLSPLRSTAEVLKVFRAAGAGLAAAHSAGVIHRDFKPANIFVESTGRVCVTDFGLAISDCDPASPQEAPVGTPAYMSPEQLDGKSASEQSDQFSYCASLYEALCGQRPFVGTNVREVREAMRANEIAIDDDRGLPAWLLAVLRRGLQEQPDKRFASMDELLATVVKAQDRRRRRRVAGLAIAAVSLVALIVFAATMAMQAHRIANERDRANREARLAEMSRAEVEGLLDFMLHDLRRKLQPVGKLELLGLVAHKAALYYQNRPVHWDQPNEVANRASALGALAEVLIAEGDLPQALKYQQQALRLGQALAAKHPTALRWRGDVSETLQAIGDILVAQGNLEGALLSYQKSLAQAKQLRSLEPTMAKWQDILAISHDDVGDILLQTGDVTAALLDYQLGLELREALAKREPDNQGRHRHVSVSHSNIAVALVEQGDMKQALEHFQISLATDLKRAMSDEKNAVWQRDLYASYLNVGQALHFSERQAEALSAFESARSIAARLAASDPLNASAQSDLAAAHNGVANVYRAMDDHQGSLREMAVALKLAEHLHERDPTNQTWLRDVSIYNDSLGEIFWETDKLKAAQEQYKKSLSIRERLASEAPTSALAQRELALALDIVGNLLQETGDLHQAIEKYRTSLTIKKQLLQQEPNNPLWQGDKLVSLAALAAVLAEVGEAEAGQNYLAKCANTSLSAAISTDDSYNVACCSALVGRKDLAFQWLTKAVEEGFADVSHLKNDDDLKSLRSDPRWTRLLSRVRDKGRQSAR